MSFDVKCYVTWNEGLQRRGVISVVDCVPGELVEVADVDTLAYTVRGIVGKVFTGLESSSVTFDSNEPIGSTHMIYRYHVNITGDKYIGVRAVVYGKTLVRLLFTVPSGVGVELGFKPEQYTAEKELEAGGPPREITVAPGQVYVDYPVVYSISGLPQVDVSKWMLSIEGEVDKPLKLSLLDLYEMGLDEIIVDFHCVTGWSVRGLVFTGVKLKKILEASKIKPSAKWIYVESLDGYTTVLPIEEAFDEKALIALEMNRKPLSIHHGYPARLLIPRLYGWKSAKWVYKLHLMSKYRDGYWESLGYHPRGRVDLEERFKKA
ncbi:MAG: molybdopterin-dependent oxidoreductase [Desulfurococcaceae archaeon]